MIRRKKALACMVALTVTCQNVTVLAKGIKTKESNNTTYITVDPAMQYQTMEGWGTSLAWWANMVGGWDMIDPNDPEERTKKEVISELIFDPENGLGINIVRYNIGGGDDPEHDHLVRMEADIPGYKANEDSDYDWKADEDQLWILEQAKEIWGNDDLLVEVFSNTPPWYMTESGCHSGNTNASKDNLKEEYYDDFAKYLVDITKYINDDMGIAVDYLEPINEPASSYWGANSEKQEGCHFDQGDSQSKIYLETYDALVESGLANKVKLTGTDETSIDDQIESLNKLSAEAMEVIDKVNTHVYGGSKRGQLRDLTDTLDKKFWMSEVCVSNADHDHDDVVSALELSDIILKDLRDMKAEAWVVWQAVESEAENYLWNNNYGLIHGMYESEDDLLERYHIKHGLTPEKMNEVGLEQGSYFVTKQYYVLGQYSKFIKPNYTIIDVDNENALAALSPDGNEMVLVVQNIDNNVKDYSFILDKVSETTGVKAYRTSSTESIAEVNGFSVENGVLQAVLPENSITTFVIDIETYNKGVSTIVNDNVIGEEINEFNYSEGWTRVNNKPESYTNDIHVSSTEGSSVEFKFNGDGIEIFGTKGPDEGKASILLDGTEVAEIDNNQSNESEGQSIVKLTGLDNSEHILEIKAIEEGRKISIDKAKVTNGEVDSTLEIPYITKLGTWNDRIVLSFKEINNADSYNVYFGTSVENMIKKNVTATSNIVLDGLDIGETYMVYVQAVVNGEEGIASQRLSVTTEKPNDSGIIYYVDCGDSTPQSVDQAEEDFGLRNSMEDQAYGVDSKSGYKWGYTSTNGTWANGSYDRFDSVRCDTSDEPGGQITYTFDLDNGDYRVNLGFTDPWNNNNRYMDIIIDDEVVETRYKSNKDTKDVKSYNNIKVENGQLSVTVQRSEGVTGGQEDPHISWIMIEEASNKSIVEVGAMDSNAICNVGDTPVLPEEVNVKYSDGTEGQANIQWEDVNTENFEIVNVAGKVVGSNVKVSAEVMVLPEDLSYFVNGGIEKEKSEEFEYISENFDILNEVADKLYVDGSWGYVEANAGAYDHPDKYQSARYAGSKSDITYKLPLEDGEYKVILGFKDPWGNYGRTMDVYIGDKKVEDRVIATTTPQTKAYENVVVKDGVMIINLKMSSGTSQDPAISFILVAPEEVKIDEAVVNVINKINELPENITLEDKVKVEEARAAYESLDAEQKRLITNLDRLIAAEDRIVELEKEQVVINKKCLEVAVEVAKKVTDEELSMVVPAIVKEFEEALAEAEDVLANENVTQQQVNESFERLSNVLQMLSFKKGDKTELQGFVDKLVVLNSEEYIKGTWDNLQAELEKAKSVLANENAMEVEVAEAYENLLKSFLELRLKPSKEKLEELINKAGSIDGSKYTEETWSAVEKTLADAKVVFENEDATESEIIEVETALENALKNLEEKIDEDKIAADIVISKINALPSNITLANKEEVVAAREAYNGLTDAQKELISQEVLNELLAVEAKITELEESAKEDQKAADEVVKEIEKLSNNITLKDKKEVEAARVAYEGLTEAQKALVTNLDKLEASESKIKELEEAAEEVKKEDQKAADKVMKEIEKLSSKITLKDKKAVESARAAYEGLTEGQKALVINLDKLEVSESKIKELEDAAEEVKKVDQKAAENVIEEIEKLSSNITLKDKKAVEAARKSYNKLTPSQKDLVTNLDKLKSAEAKITEILSSENNGTKLPQTGGIPGAIPLMAGLMLTGVGVVSIKRKR